MAKRKTPKVEKPQLETGNVEIQIDGAKVVGVFSISKRMPPC